MMPKVFIIVLNWNGWKDTIECLESLKKVNYSNFEILAVDNGSTNESTTKIENFLNQPPYPQRYKIINLRNNLGFSGGNNAGIKYALENGADYVLLLNNDTTVAPDFLNKLVETGENDARIGIIGPLVYFFYEPQKIWFGGGKINWLKNKATHLHYQEIDKGNLLKNFETEYITGCALLIKKEVIEKIGFMAEDYFLYYEDTDWNLKAKKAGYKIILEPQAKIWHKVSASTKEFSSNYVYYNVRNGMLFARRFGNIFTKNIVYLQSIYILLKQLIKVAMPSKRTWGMATIKGIIHFYQNTFGQLQ